MALSNAEYVVATCAWCGEAGPHHLHATCGEWFCTDLCDHAAGAYYCEYFDGDGDAEEVDPWVQDELDRMD